MSKELKEINVMEGINFKYNQRISKIEDEIRKQKAEKKKRERLVNILLSICIVITSILIIIYASMIFSETNKDIDNCVEKGHSKAYCEKAILGN